MSDGLVSETLTIGREGMLGVEVMLGDRRSLTRAVVQLEGAAWRLDARHLEATLARSPILRRLCLGHVRALLGQALQNAACNSLHQAEARLCRWLLLVHDRADGDELPLTHEFLAEMLGLARRSVTVVAQALQERGLIRYRPKLVTVLDRAGLEAAACECYAAIRAHLARLLSDPPGRRAAGWLLGGTP